MDTKELSFIAFCEWLKASRSLKNWGFVASTIGITAPGLSAIRTGKNKLGIDLLGTLAFNHPQLNLHWLLTGVGDMLDGKKVLVSTAQGVEEYIPQPYSPVEESSEESTLVAPQRGADAYTKAVLAGITLPTIKSSSMKQRAKSEAALAQIEEWKNKCYDLMEKYNDCLEKNIKNII